MLKCLAVILLMIATVSCQSVSTDPSAVVRKWLDAAGKSTVKITQIVSGNPQNEKADALWCVETDATAADGQRYLLLVYNTGTNWVTQEMTDGEYEWDLNGCPRT